MQNKEKWRPSKFEIWNGKLRASRNINEVGSASRLVADLVATFYDSEIPKHVTGRLLDLGCGKVPLFAVYKEFITDNVCVDWANSIHQNPYLDQICDLNQSLPYADAVFNSIILSDVLEHIREPQLLWSEMGRILVHGGKILMNVPFYYRLHEEPYDYYRYTRHALKFMAEQNGFEILMLQPIGGAPEILTDILAKLVIKIPFIGIPLAVVLQRITWGLIKSKWGKKISSNTAKQFPLGYVLIAAKL